MTAPTYLKLFRLTAAGSLLAIFCWSQQNGPVTVEFDRDVHTILAAKCLTCHSAEKRSGGLSLATYADVLDGGRSGAAVRPGNSAASLIVHRITGTAAPQMPLALPALMPAEITTIRTWIDQGARATPTSAPARGK